MAKPAGAACNLACRYCFYLEKAALLTGAPQLGMPDAVLEAYVREYIAAQDTPEVSFAWQGGEPTLLGVEFYRRAVELQRRHACGKRVTNSIQTNGTRLDDEWGAFLHEHDFLVGLSLDGPRRLHDRYRVDRGGAPTFEAVMHGLEVLKRYQVRFNTLTCVSRANQSHALEVYRFLKEVGAEFMQFIPVVERQPSAAEREAGLALAMPPHDDARAGVTDWSVGSSAFGEFLNTVFDEWVRHDVGRVYVQYFDVALGAWLGADPALCVFASRCGAALALERNGDVYACDHYVYPDYRRGNVLERPLGEIVNAPEQVQFGLDKSARLPETCRSCQVRFACNGGCPKHRFARTPGGEPGLSYLCPSYKAFFSHIAPYMDTMARLLRAGRPAADIMPLLAERERVAAFAAVGRNDPCPCGSGKKYKKCCLGKTRQRAS